MTDAALQDVPLDDSLFRGVVEVERTERGVQPHRLPAWARRQLADPQLLMAEAQPSGVRLVFRTAATTIEVTAQPTRVGYVGTPPRPLGVYELVVDGVPSARASVDGGDLLTIDMTTGGTAVTHGDPGAVTFAGLAATDKTVEIWLPHNELTELVALRADAPVEAVPAQRRVWLHHGSSISHGSSALDPTGTWPAVAAAAGGVDLVNLGFSGSALLDPATARTMRDLPADVISVKMGINLVNLDLMRVRGFTAAMHGFLDTIRDGHPDTPLLLVSPILCPIHEDTPGPGGPDPATLGTGQVTFRAAGNPAEVVQGKLTLRVIREQIRQIVEARRAADPNLHHLDGLELYGEVDAEVHPLPDALHPDADTHRIMGERFAAFAFAPGGPLA